MPLYSETLFTVFSCALMYTAAKLEERNRLLWVLVAIAWALVLGRLFGPGTPTAIVALVGSYSTMFVVNIVGERKPR